VIKDRKGRKVKDVMQLRPAKAGQDIYLSFDARVQYIAHRELAKAVQEHEAEAAYLVAIDVKTGEILAMVNQPAYNPNNRSKLVPDQLRNRSITDMFEPGSTMKVFTVMAALESGKYTTSSLFNTNPGRFQVYNKTVTDHNNYGIINLETLIVKSSNVASAQIAGSLPKETLPMIHRRFGFGSVTESGFPGESRGILQPPQRWNPVEVATMSYGYGVSVTALQLARAYAAIANHGVSHPISLTKLTQAPQSTALISDKIVSQLFPMMESVVSSDGTAIKAAIPGYRVAGKTGTAHKAKAGSYAKDEYMSLFAGFAPVSDPRVVMVVVMDGAKKGGYYGGTVSAPVFSRVMAETLRLMNIPLDKSLDAPVKAKAKTTIITPPLVTQPKGHA
jgi:cell division protein FtsI (penicillin-binding protein 3)